MNSDEILTSSFLSEENFPSLNALKMKKNQIVMSRTYLEFTHNPVLVVVIISSLLSTVQGKGMQPIVKPVKIYNIFKLLTVNLKQNKKVKFYALVYHKILVAG